MRLFILACVALFILVIISAVIKTKSVNRQATRKRHHEKKRPSPSAKHAEARKPQVQAAADNSNLAVDAALGLSQQASEAVDMLKDEVVTIAPKKPLIKFVVLNVMARPDEVFRGYELLQALLAKGLRYGKTKIFHRYENRNGQGEELFSLASATKPGTFDLPKISSFTCVGLSLFMILEDSQNPRNAFEVMLETAQQLSEDLRADLCDDKRLPLSKNTIDDIRANIDIYVKEKLVSDLPV